MQPFKPNQTNYCFCFQLSSHRWSRFDQCLCCSRKAWAAIAQSFTLWQQATIEITCHDHYSSLTCHIYSLRTSCSWWIAHSTQLQMTGCNIWNALEPETSQSLYIITCFHRCKNHFLLLVYDNNNNLHCAAFPGYSLERKTDIVNMCKVSWVLTTSAVEITRRLCYWHIFIFHKEMQCLDFSSFNRPGF